MEKTEEELAFETAEVASANPYAGKTIAELKEELTRRGVKFYARDRKHASSFARSTCLRSLA